MRPFAIIFAIIAAFTAAATALADGPIIGEIMFFAGYHTDAPAGWIPCDGREIGATTYADACAIFDTNFGTGAAGNCVAPDMQARFPLGAFTDLTYPENWRQFVGATGGEEDHTLTTNEMPSHNHYQRRYTNSTGVVDGMTGDPSALGSYVNSNVTANTGGGAAHNNMPPYLVVSCLVYIGGVSTATPTATATPTSTPTATPTSTPTAIPNWHLSDIQQSFGMTTTNGLTTTYSNDGIYQTWSEAGAMANQYIESDFHNLPGGAYKLTFDGYYTGGHTVKLQCSPNGSGGWVDLATLTSSASADETITVNLPAGCDGGTEVHTRLSHTGTGIGTHRLYIDQLYLDYQSTAAGPTAMPVYSTTTTTLDTGNVLVEEYRATASEQIIVYLLIGLITISVFQIAYRIIYG